VATLAPVAEESAYSPPEPATTAGVEPSPSWSPATRVAFRFCVLYFAMYVVSTQMLPGLVVIPGGFPPLETLPPLRDLVMWIGNHVLGISHTIAFRRTGSGDKLFNWVHAFTLLVFAAIGTIVWSGIARNRVHHARVFSWFRVFLRFALGTTFLGYGFAKVIPLQMPTLMLTKLVEPFGNFSPMGVLWYSIGASPAYETFTGLAEVCAGVLLFLPWTAQLGALMGIMNSIAIFALNMTYDVPVKLFSFHLILMSIFLAAPNARRLFDLFILHRPSSIRREPPVGRSARARRNLVIAQVLFGLYTLCLGFYGNRLSWKQFGGGAPKSALFGIWDVEQMTVDGQVRPPLATDTTRWRRAIFQRPTDMSFQRPNDTFKGYGTTIDTVAKTLTLAMFDSTKTTFALTYERPAKNRLIVDGTMDGHAVHMELAYRDPDSFLQRSRGFHWISEVPFNR
jgi:hypothetical protein